MQHVLLFLLFSLLTFYLVIISSSFSFMSSSSLCLSPCYLDTLSTVSLYPCHLVTSSYIIISDMLLCHHCYPSLVTCVTLVSSLACIPSQGPTESGSIMNVHGTTLLCKPDTFFRLWLLYADFAVICVTGLLSVGPRTGMQTHARHLAQRQFSTEQPLRRSKAFARVASIAGNSAIQ